VSVQVPFNAVERRADFPILQREVRPGVPVIYLDSTATSQKPLAVIEAMDRYYRQSNANVHRGIHTLAEEATALYEGARERVRDFIHARTVKEVIFARNTTEAINLVAYSWGRANIQAGDTIVYTEMEHHSNLVPWQLLCERTGATLKWFGITDEGRLDEAGLDSLISSRTKIVSVVHMSNVLGTVNDVSRIAARCKDVGALLMLDCSQSVPHLPISVGALGADLIAFTGHKMLGPTGIGVLWGRFDLLSQMPPFLAGGSMIETVTMGGTTFAAPPARFEAGTPPITEAIGLGAAVDYLTGLGMEAIHQHEQTITAYALDALSSVPGVRIFGPATIEGRGGTVSFGVDGVHPHDVGQVLDALGVEVRVGHHCARPVCSRFSVPAMTRASFYLYTTTAEIDALARGLDQVRKVFG
jgi:cysteine desulfurase/selenocysteine lyase